MMHYVIIGMGVAGFTAVESIRRRDPHGEIHLVSEEPEGYYSRPGLAYYLSDEITEKLLFPFTHKEIHTLGVTQHVARALCILPEIRRVELSGPVRLSYDRLLIATGAEARPLDIPGSEAEGVVKLDCLGDARAILRQARRTKQAVVVGGGITALELVEGLRARRVKVHYLLRGERYWNNVLDPIEARIIEKRLKEEGVQIHYHSELGEVIQKNGRVVGVRTKDGLKIDCELLAVAVGIQPRIELAVAAGIAVERGILVDEYLRTNLPDIFAAGDVAQVYDPASGKAMLDSLWGPAREQGAVAGLNMASSPEEFQPYSKKVPFNVTRLAGLTTTIIGTVGQGRDDDLLGIARGDSETWRQLPDVLAVQSDFEVNRVRLLLGERQLVGAVVMGDQKLSHPLQHLIRQGVDISPIHERLLQPGAPLAEIIIEYWLDYQQREGHAA